MLQLLAIDFPNISPVALGIGPVEIKWYGLAYGVGLVVGWLYVRRLLATPAIWPPDHKSFPADLATDLALLALFIPGLTLLSLLLLRKQER